MAPVTTVAAVANIAESATISVVAHASSTNSSCMNLAKYMFSTIQAICPIRPKKRRQNQTLPPRGVVLVAVEETECSRVIFPRLSDVGTSDADRPHSNTFRCFRIRDLLISSDRGVHGKTEKHKSGIQPPLPPICPFYPRARALSIPNARARVNNPARMPFFFPHESPV